MNPYALLIISLSLILGTTTTIMSNHWMLAWAGLEVSTLAIIPLMTKIPHPRAIEAATKYFLTQAAASAMILFAVTQNAWLGGEWLIPSTPHSSSTTLITIALSMKLGIAPFHFWLPDVLQGLTLQTGLILSTWQKLAPTALLIQLSPLINLNLLLTLGLLSTIIGGIGGINQTQVRKILAFSSIAHLGWMVTVLKFSPELALFNFITYTLMTSTLFMVLSTMNTKTLPELMIAWSKTPTLTALSLLSILSLSGLPPLTGFLPKWLIAQELIKQHMTLYATIMLLSALLSLFFYLRLIYILSLTLAPHPLPSTLLWPSCPKNYSAVPLVLTLLLLPIAPTISAFI
uniref:NADH-ubiquinone oxidoreductase chain 2 n=1 Tax=Craugastor augusti TaxID=228429 RepID=Q53EF4_9NEOB|nr:NADH dehydrogenase subunit II [Craugastor augusti]